MYQLQEVLSQITVKEWVKLALLMYAVWIVKELVFAPIIDEEGGGE